MILRERVLRSAFALAWRGRILAVQKRHVLFTMTCRPNSREELEVGMFRLGQLLPHPERAFITQQQRQQPRRGGDNTMGDFNNVKLEPHFNFNLRRSDQSSTPAKRTRSVGILNMGRGNTFLYNSFSGYDVGIQDEGQDTKAIGNRFE